MDFGFIILFIGLGIIFLPIILWLYVYRYNRRIYETWEEQSKTWTICPHCGNLVWLSAFTCPKCKTNNELPPPYMDGDANVIQYSPCKSCGTMLPLVHYYGREKLAAVCPYCSGDLGTQAGVYQEAVIPILGSRSTGKSAYLAALTYRLQQKFGNRLSFPFQGLAEYVEESNKLFIQGFAPKQTPPKHPKSFVIDITNTKYTKNAEEELHDMRLFFYDSGGELFDKEEKMSNLVFFDIMDELIILVDPFRIPEVRQQYTDFLTEHSGFRDNIGVGDFGDNVARIRNGMYKYRYKDYEYNSQTDHAYLGKKERHYTYCAVVITKADALINDTVIQSLLNGNINPENMDAVCREKLEEWGLGNDLEKLEDIVQEVRCFCVSSFGHMPNGKSFTPKCVELPLLWFLNKKLH
ncbi:MAG: hypothetical protein LBE12_05915 [Planctomycetaceae bacterium]|jgi:hypothetical protein|nr:hypothetical protein [Planctomycetaceae bacterium]